MYKAKANVYKGVGAYLQTLRIREGLTQARVAESLKIHQALVSQWERGLSHISLEDCLRLLRLYGERERAVNIQAMLSGIESDFQQHPRKQYHFCPYCGEKLDHQKLL